MRPQEKRELKMERLTQNPRLLALVHILEDEMGEGKIELGIMDDEHAKNASCSIRKNPENASWEMLYIPKEPPTDDMICHELMHVILCFEGFPGVEIPSMLPPNSWEANTIGFLFNLVLHLEVWPMSEQFGFSELERYNNAITTQLIPITENAKLLFEYENYLEDIRRIYYLCSGLLCPTHNDTKEHLTRAIKKSYPHLYQDVLNVCELCKKHLPLTPQLFQSLCNILSKPLLLPDNIIRLVPYIDPPRPDFRTKVFSALEGNLCRSDK